MLNYWDKTLQAIREATENRGVAEFARKVGVDRKTVEAWRKGAYPGVEMLGKIAEALGSEPWILLKPDDSTNSEAKVVENPELLNRILAVWGTFNEDQRRLLAQNAEAFAARINPANQSSKPVSKHKKAGA